MSNEDSGYSHSAPATTSGGAGEGTFKGTASIQPTPLPDNVTSATSIIAAPTGDDGSELPKDSTTTPVIKEPTPDPVQSVGAPGVDDQDIDAMLREIGWESRGKPNRPTAPAPATGAEQPRPTGPPR